VAVVTGAARGIGLSIAHWFLDRGYAVALLDIDEATLRATAAGLALPERVLALQVDVSNPAQVETAFDLIDGRFGRLDALVNNAGVAVFKPIEQTGYDEWRWVMSTNLDGPFLCTQAAAPRMLRHGGGAVVNVASISGLRASTLRVAYGTSKAALIHLTKQQAVEYGNVGIRVNAIAPGPGGNRNGQKGAHPRHPGRLPQHHSAGPLRLAGRNGPGGRLSVQPRGQLHQRPGAGGGRRL
jgi:meso-butanediol dehydrogenase / (S,S)-butanediol dehydrogenase / diacetyl reductase